MATLNGNEELENEKIKVIMSSHDDWTKLEKPIVIAATKKGRRFRPSFSYEVKGLNPKAKYIIGIHMEEMDNYRYDFVDGEFMKSENLEKKPKKGEIVFHPEEVQSGELWMETSFNFNIVRLTFDKAAGRKAIFVNLRRRYRPILTIKKKTGSDYTGVGSYQFDGVEFISVTKKEYEIIRKHRFNMMALRLENGILSGFEAKTVATASSSSSPVLSEEDFSRSFASAIETRSRNEDQNQTRES